MKLENADAGSTNQTRKRNVACIGAGYWGQNIIRNMADIGALAWICEMDSRRREEFSKKYPGVRITDSFAEILADPAVEGVAIATPAETHARLVRESLEAGKDVFVEKPLSLSVGEGEKLVAIAKERNRVLMVGHLLWYHPAVLKLKELVASGELGRLRYIYSNRLNFGKIRREENILWSFAPHDISVVLGLVGESPDRIEAQGGNYLHERIADVTVSLLSFPSGVKAHVFVSWLHPFKEQKLVVVGDKKMAVFNDLEKSDKLVLYPHVIDWKDQMPVITKADGVVVPVGTEEPLRQECLHFLDCVARRCKPRTDGEEGLRVLKVLDQCQSALGQKQPTAPKESTSAAVPLFKAHPTAHVATDALVGEGTTVWHFSHIMSGTRVGKACRIGQNVVIGPRASIGDSVKIQNNVSVYEGVTLEDGVFCGPSMVFTNVMNPRSEIPRMSELKTTLVKKGATLGANSTIVCGTTIGKYAFVGAGAVVTRDVPDYGLVFGNPAKLKGWMCSCGNRIQFDAEKDHGTCVECKKRFKKDGNAVQEA